MSKPPLDPLAGDVWSGLRTRADDLKAKRRERRVWLVMAGILALPILYVLWGVYPADWVVVRVDGLPATAVRFCLVAEVADRPRTMADYESKIAPVAIPVISDGEFHGLPPDRPFVHPLRWVTATRYGVLMRHQDGRFRLWWLGPGDLDPPWTLACFFGSGHAAVRVPPEGRAEVPDAAWLRSIGLVVPEASPGKP